MSPFQVVTVVYVLLLAVLAKGFELVVSPRDLAVNEGGDATFRCSVGATSSIMATLLWEKDKTRVTRDGSRIAISERQKNVSDQLIIITSELHIQNVRERDVGDYHCRALFSNSEFLESKLAKLTVHAEIHYTDQKSTKPTWTATGIPIVIGTLLLPVGVILGLIAVLLLKLWVHFYMNKYRALSQQEMKKSFKASLPVENTSNHFLKAAAMPPNQSYTFVLSGPSPPMLKDLSSNTNNASNQRQPVEELHKDSSAKQHRTKESICHVEEI